MDITDLILNDHHDQRRLFSYLDEIDGSEVGALGAIWTRLSTLLEVHAAAEEALSYPELLKLGTRGAGHDHTVEEVTDVIKDHNEIRDAIGEVAQHRVGSDGWREAVAKTREANGDHMAEEERDDLADFRRYADLQLRRTIAVAFAEYQSYHVGGVEVHDTDPGQYVTAHS